MIDLDEHVASEEQADATPWALDNLPPFPVVATRLLNLLSAEDVNITEAGKMIAADPVFATRVLQLANSPLFALRREVKTISHAIIVLGLQRIKAVTLTRVMGDFVAPVLKIKALRACWRNSLAGAILAERLARPCQMDPDFAYAAGLLRDIGRLALLVKYPESYANVLAVSGEHSFDLMTTERDLFDIDHCQAGVWMIEKMPFPPELSEVVAHHHTLLGKPFRMVHVVRIADMLADTLGFAVITPVNAMGFDEVRRELPEMARSRFTSSPEELAADVDARIQAWD